MALSKPINIMHIFEQDKQRFIVNDYKNIDKIFLHPEVADRKIVVLLTLGAFRKGKSFLLDYCLRYLYANYRSINNQSILDKTDEWLGLPSEPLSGFSWKHGRKADTKGIIMWSDVFLHETSRGEKLAIVVMDTQGLFEGGSTPDENARIFSLSILIASIQIINIKELIQEDQLEYLNMAVSMSQMVMKKYQNEGGSESSKIFQKLVFLMRDWSDDKLAFGFEGGEVYLNETLSETFNSETATSVREHIRESFDKIKCCLFPHPGEEVTKSSFDGCHGLLKPEFVTALKEFIETILAPQNLKVKSILGREIIGREFCEYATSYFEAFRSEEIPKLESILEVTVKNQMEGITENCVQFYHRGIKNSSIDFNHESREDFCNSLAAIHEAAKRNALELFKNTPKLKKNDDEDYNLKLTSRIESFFEDWKADNLKNFDETIKLKEALKEMKQDKEEMTKKIEEIEKNARTESENNAKARAKAEEEMQAKLRKAEQIQAESLKQQEVLLSRLAKIEEDKIKTEEKMIKMARNFENEKKENEAKRRREEEERRKFEENEKKKREKQEKKQQEEFDEKIRRMEEDRQKEREWQEEKKRLEEKYSKEREEMEAKRRKEDEARTKEEAEERKRMHELQRKREEEEEAARKRQEEDRKKAFEEIAKIKEELQQENEARRIREVEERKKQDEEKIKKLEEEKRYAEERAAKMELENERRRQEEDFRRRLEDDRRKQAECSIM